jgi:hypothetical protein
VEYTRTSEDAARQALDVLLQVRKVWPELASAPYFIQGLSYAGHYVPWMAKVVMENSIPLQGIAVGDPLIDHIVQAPTYSQNLASLGLVGESEQKLLELIMANSTRLWRDGKDCVSAFHEWNRVWNDDGGSSCEPNCDFLFQKWTGSSNTEHALLGAPPTSHFRAWLAQHEGALHVAGSPNAGGAAGMKEGGRVYATMVESGDFCSNTAPLYADIFAAGVDVVLYAGNMDPLLGAPVVSAAVDAIWQTDDQREAFERAPKQVWFVNGEDSNPAGYARCVGRQVPVVILIIIIMIIIIIIIIIVIIMIIVSTGRQTPSGDVGRYQPLRVMRFAGMSPSHSRFRGRLV